MNQFVLPFLGLSLLLWTGHWLRLKIRLFRVIYLPSSVIGGILGLFIIELLRSLNCEFYTNWITGWSSLPGFLINLVFACLFLGVSLPGFKTIVRKSGPQLAYGQIVAWGQYFVGIGVFLLIIHTIWPHIPAMFGAIMPVGFEGGHGTAGGLSDTFKTLGWEAGKDFALASATVGIVSAVVLGMGLINWAIRKGYCRYKVQNDEETGDNTLGIIPAHRRPSAGKLSVNSDVVESLSLHLAIVGLAVFLGVSLREIMIMGHSVCDPFLSQKASSNMYILVNSFPLFPLCMIGGLVIQFLSDRFDRHRIIDPELMKRIQNTSLDFLIVAAIATISINILKEGIFPFLILMLAGIIWNLFCVFFLARKMLPDAWFERAIAEMGQSMGVTATGLLLLRVIDPDYTSPAADAFAYKQLLHEPVMGGGLWTSMAIPLLAIGGASMPWKIVVISLGIMILWIVASRMMIRGKHFY